MSGQPPATTRPASLWALFCAFTWLALQGFGGVLAVAQRELVERLNWLSREDFVEMLAIAQVLPGPNVVNLSLMIGDRFFGLRGAFSALAGMLLLPSLIVIALAALYGQLAAHPLVADVLRGMGAVSAGLIIGTGIKLLPALRRNAIGRWPAFALAALSFIAILVFRLPLPLLVLVFGGLGMFMAWRQLK
ncbi:chromate transporter [Roseateles violae]|uniref:Chromate transporter n=1 Tax=Roseateles violae TaxID=3058042 RepID=A0ABT8DU09_9BURK|nr:chromate transporter [Pelomonas sp. PFR6]MDN3921785.1 chromate transporter [Pelomonas sp. PFR6]